MEQCYGCKSLAARIEQTEAQLRQVREALSGADELVLLDSLARALHREHCMTDASYEEHFAKHPHEIETAWDADGRNRALWISRARVTLKVFRATLAAQDAGTQRQTTGWIYKEGGDGE